jgi:tRNA modification GTPase
MEFLYSDDPIIACSSGGQSNTAIAIIRLSGFKDLSLLNKFFDKDLNKIKSRFAYFCKVIDDTETLDEIIFTYFKGPNSYNGENILELSVHGNIFNIERIIKLFVSKANFRQANPGEFTYRALKNKKLSLSQVEGLDLLLNASSPFSLKQGFSLLSGRLQDSYTSLYNNFLNHKSSVELSIDFYEDIGEEQSQQQLKDSLVLLVDSIKSLKIRINRDSLNLVSPDITLVGLPNAGKSSLFNKLLSEDRAIVSNIAGTTRDFISEKIRIADTHFNLIDTAGVRDSENVIESEGIRRALNLINKSFFKILVINPFEFDINFFKELKDINFDLIVFSHSDSDDYFASVKTIKESIKDFISISISGPIEPNNYAPMGANDNGSIGPSYIGSIGANLIDQNNEIINTIESLVNKKYLEVSSKEPIIIERHIELINNIYLLISKYSELCSNEEDISIISSELNIVGHCISELIGIVSPDDVLHNIFDNFCIGK